MTVLQEEDWERHRLWREDRDRRFAVRVAKQDRLHALDPERYSLLVPVDDDEFPDESFTAGWADEEPDEPEPGYANWDGDCPDAANSQASDLDDDDTDGWLPRIVYEPWALSGDLPEPEEVLSRYPDLAGSPRWAIYLIGPDDGDINASETGLTLAEAHERERSIVHPRVDDIQEPGRF